MKQPAFRDTQEGAALFVALMFLIIITMLSLAAMRSSVLELRMASNQELKNTAFHRAQALVDATIGDTTNMPTLGNIGVTNCMPSDPAAATAATCKSTGVVLDDAYLSGATYDAYFDGSTANGEIHARVTRLAPLEKAAPRSIGTSAAVYSVATYEIDGNYDLSEIGLGKARIREGLMLLISK